MSGHDADNLLRLRVARVTGRLPEDLASWAIDLVETAVSATDREAGRNRLLRRAAAMLDGSRWARAAALADEIEHVERLWCSDYEQSEPDMATVRGLVLAARAVAGSLPRSRRQLLRMLW